MTTTMQSIESARLLESLAIFLGRPEWLRGARLTGDPWLLRVGVELVVTVDDPDEAQAAMLAQVGRCFPVDVAAMVRQPCFDGYPIRWEAAPPRSVASTSASPSGSGGGSR